ncbi:glycine/D-amino acid oxidase-like deaminating enzyme [Bradyrhizobium sp. F1.2.2]
MALPMSLRLRKDLSWSGYTNTLRADLRPDDGNEFIIARLPDDPRIIVASPCSGHRAKFASAIGAMLADMSLDPRAKAPQAFRLDRLSGFANWLTTTTSAGTIQFVVR